MLAGIAVASSAQTFTTLASFDKHSNGAQPTFSSLAQGLDGNLYGTTPVGGIKGGGTVFTITPGGTLTTLHSFCSLTNCTDGESPEGGIAQGTDGNFYGTTEFSGIGEGEVFKINSGGSLTTLVGFKTSDGAQPFGALVQATNGNFYGTTARGGAGAGTVFTITLEGKTAFAAGESVLRGPVCL
jgi:uncharacterized repeat protein (TIGR03803 family)